MTKIALITGVSGPDGAYLAKLLIDKGYRVVGASRDAQAAPFVNLGKLGIRDRVKAISISLNDFRSVLQALVEVKPDEIYNLAAQSSVGLSFDQPVETMESISIGTLNLLEAIRFIGRPVKLYNAGSSECFGDTGGVAADEATPFRPRSPYAVAKSAAFWEVANYRDAYDLFACSGILFNHESPLRPDRFVTKKIVNAACRIAGGSGERLSLGNLDIQRDWGWAPEYVEAMWLMLQRTHPEDFVIATGESNTLRDFVALVFSSLGLNWQDHIDFDPGLVRPSELMVSRADPGKAARELGWRAQYRMKEVVGLLVENSRQASN
ncbi:MAG: GDP-mannose 4,6-dehydratase [Burkholderiales bacterium]|nr:GDP-mannose 4,6-dehydratase [Burkholderiales bacterium]